MNGRRSLIMSSPPEKRRKIHDVPSTDDDDDYEDHSSEDWSDSPPASDFECLEDSESTSEFESDDNDNSSDESYYEDSDDEPFIRRRRHARAQTLSDIASLSNESEDSGDDGPGETSPLTQLSPTPARVIDTPNSKNRQTPKPNSMTENWTQTPATLDTLARVTQLYTAIQQLNPALEVAKQDLETITSKIEDSDRVMIEHEHIMTAWATAENLLVQHEQKFGDIVIGENTLRRTIKSENIVTTSAFPDARDEKLTVPVSANIPKCVAVEIQDYFEAAARLIRSARNMQAQAKKALGEAKHERVALGQERATKQALLEITQDKLEELEKDVNTLPQIARVLFEGHVRTLLKG